MAVVALVVEAAPARGRVFHNGAGRPHVRRGPVYAGRARVYDIFAAF